MFNLSIEELKRSATEGNTEAQAILGRMYFLGIGLAKDLKKAEDLLQSAKQSHSPAGYFARGFCYENGISEPKNEEEAVRWYRQAAEQEFVPAQNALGLCLLTHQETTVEAVAWFRLAAEKKYAEAQNNLGLCYRDGRGVTKDEEKAVKWFQLAARCGLALAQYNLSICYLNGTGIRKNEAEAVKWFQQAANQSFALAQYNLGSCFLSGIGTDKNESEAVHWYQLAAQQRLAIAQNALGICYAEGIGISINVTEAVNWFHLAANQGIAIAQYRLAQFYEAGRGVAYNIQKSLSLLHSAAGQGLADAQVQLGMNCLKSIGGNLSDAIKWFQLAAAQGNSLAQQILIDCVAIGSESALGGMTEEASRLLADAYNKSIEAQYMVGFNYMYGFKGFPQNEELARKWLTSAKNGGHPKASGLLFALPIIMAPAASLLFFQRPRGENAAGPADEPTESTRLVGHSRERFCCKGCVIS